MAELDVTKFKVGSVFYGVRNTINAYHRKKIYREIDGEQWFKYDLPLASYSIVTYTVIGILNKTLEGEWEPHSDYELCREIYVSLETDGKTEKYTMYTDDIEAEKYFLDKAEALAYIDTMHEKDREIDRK